ncbi:MAG TPA: DsrE family protein [Chitinophagaceae bacterium]
MKKLLSFLAPMLFAPLILFAQKPDYRVVFDLTSKDPAVHQTILRWVSQITAETPDAQLEVVFYGGSLDMIRNDRSTFTSEIASLTKNNNVHFVACEMALKRHNIQKSQLLAGVKTVPDGIYELISKQREGWGYIKVTPQ